VKIFRYFLSAVVLVLVCVQCRPIGPPGGGRDRYLAEAKHKTQQMAVSAQSRRGTSTSSMLRQVNLKVDMVRKGTYGRRSARSMKPRYITIHSTQNYTAGAERHSLALKRGALRTGQRPGYLIWHYTVDDGIAVQHMPTTEQGIHADFNGPGNHASIGIEMCENKGNSRSRTIEHTAMLTAVLMKQNGIPLKNVVPHYHWPRRGKSPAHKNCPHYLMDNGKPGAKWRWFQGRVNYYYRQLNG
jgi:N-acetylmuramoyl-L-alanine amidase